MTYRRRISKHCLLSGRWLGRRHTQSTTRIRSRIARRGADSRLTRYTRSGIFVYVSFAVIAGREALALGRLRETGLPGFPDQGTKRYGLRSGPRTAWDETSEYQALERRGGRGYLKSPKTIAVTPIERYTRCASQARCMCCTPSRRNRHRA